jgi:hypothetical protein
VPSLPLIFPRGYARQELAPFSCPYKNGCQGFTGPAPSTLLDECRTNIVSWGTIIKIKISESKTRNGFVGFFCFPGFLDRLRPFFLREGAKRNGPLILRVSLVFLAIIYRHLRPLDAFLTLRDGDSLYLLIQMGLIQATTLGGFATPNTCQIEGAGYFITPATSCLLLLHI